MDTNDKNEEEKLLHDARAKASKLRQFYTNIITFILVNILLLVINLLFSPHNLWFYWVTIIWGIVLLFQGVNTYSIKNKFLGDAWEEDKARELFEKEKARREKK